MTISKLKPLCYYIFTNRLFQFILYFNPIIRPPQYYDHFSLVPRVVLLLRFYCITVLLFFFCFFLTFLRVKYEQQFHLATRSDRQTEDRQRASSWLSLKSRHVGGGGRGSGEETNLYPSLFGQLVNVPKKTRRKSFMVKYWM